jgi:hypothetical protein
LLGLSPEHKYAADAALMIQFFAPPSMIMNKIILLPICVLFPLIALGQTFEKRVTIKRPAEGSRPYYYVPFEVPIGVKSLSISYEYDKKDGANTLDLGVFDPCVSKDGNDLCGFRGWSGGRRTIVFISDTAATHGYIPGRIPAGQWRMILGLYKVATEGVDVTVKVRFNEIDAQAEAEWKAENEKILRFAEKPRMPAPRADGYTWYRGDLHMHTFNSDGNWTVKGILDFANANNFDFVGITDHNTYSHHAEIDTLAPAFKNLLVLRGEEVTTYGGHFNVWGLSTGRLIDFRVAPSDSLQVTNIWREGVPRNLLVSVNHPTALCPGCAWSYGDQTWGAASSVEIWNGAWDLSDEAALKKWDDLLKQYRIVAIGSSDSHRPPTEDFKDGSPIGTPTNFVGAERLTQKDILQAIRQGRVWIAENPNSYTLNFKGETDSTSAVIGDVLEVRPNDEIKFRLAGTGFPIGAIIKLISGGTALKTFALDKKNFSEEFIAKPTGNSYFRLEVRDANGKMLAFTNPIYTREKH